MEKMYEVRLVRKQVLDTVNVKASSVEEAKKMAETRFSSVDLDVYDLFEVYCSDCQYPANLCVCDE